MDFLKEATVNDVSGGVDSFLDEISMTLTRGASLSSPLYPSDATLGPACRLCAVFVSACGCDRSSLASSPRSLADRRSPVAIPLPIAGLSPGPRAYMACCTAELSTELSGFHTERYDSSARCFPSIARIA